MARQWHIWEMGQAMTTITHYEADDLVVSLDVTFDPDAGLSSLIGGTVVALATSDTGTTVAANTATITSATNIRASWNENTLAKGLWLIQIRATVTGITQTLAEVRVTSLESITP